MDYLRFAYLHLATVLPAFVLGTIIMFGRKGTPQHKAIGRVYMALMATTAILTLFMKAQVGPTLFGHFGYIHLLSLLTIWTVPAALIAAKNGRIKVHRQNMMGLCVGGLLLAGAFAFAPGRLLHDWLFGTHLAHIPV